MQSYIGPFQIKKNGNIVRSLLSSNKSETSDEEIEISFVKNNSNSAKIFKIGCLEFLESFSRVLLSMPFNVTPMQGRYTLLDYDDTIDMKIIDGQIEYSYLGEFLLRQHYSDAILQVGSCLCGEVQVAIKTGRYNYDKKYYEIPAIAWLEMNQYPTIGN